MKRNPLTCIAVIVWASAGLVVEGAPTEVPAGDQAAVVRHLLDQAGITRGVCSILYCDDTGLILDLARSDRFLIHTLDSSAPAVAAAREGIDKAGFYGKQATIERGTLNSLPYADNIIDLVIAPSLTEARLSEFSLAEVLRVLRPGGKAIFGCAKQRGAASSVTADQLRAWAGKAGAGTSPVSEDQFGLWLWVTKRPMAGVDAWSHWEHGPDNNPVSTDAVIKAPYMTQWLSEPYYIAMPAITTAAGGRIFIAMGHIAHHQREESWLNTLLAQNGYNGTPLWQRKLPDGYLAHRSAFVATEDTFYMIDTDGTGCLLLEPDTGREKGRVEIPGFPGEWKWMAMQDNTLFALVGEQKDPAETTIVRSQYTHWSWGELSRGYYQKQVPWGFGTTILAYDMNAGKLLWFHKEEASIDSRSMVIGGGRVFFFAPDSCLGCLDAVSGKLVWTNGDRAVRDLIDQPGRGLTSTPGFRTTCYTLYTPKVLFYEAQTKMHVVAVSVDDGRLLWHRPKTTSNPNMLFADDNLLVGIGAEGSTLVVNPLTGDIIRDLGFKKRSCARLTATSDSFFCRGWPEGLTRYDRLAEKVLFNGAFRPSCNDGVVPANGLLYLGPWTCDCNLSLMGRVALCSAGDFRLDRTASEDRNLERVREDVSRVAPLEISAGDWPTYRGGTARSAGSPASIARQAARIWEFIPPQPNRPTAPTAAGGLIFLAGDDGKVRAIDAATGLLRWCFLTAGPILQPPAIWEGRAYVGSGDGYVYALEAATGRLLWRFRAAPVERRIMLYGSLCSTWPVNTGVLVSEGVAYAAAGLIDYDGTYVYALDAVTGKILWQNNSSGHLQEELRKGVSAQGVLTIAEGRLWMPGGNVISPAAYDLKSGSYAGGSPGDGSPRSNRGEEIGVLRPGHLVLGGRLRYSATQNVVDPGTFEVIPAKAGGRQGRSMPLHSGKIAPAWNDERIVFVDGRQTMPICWGSAKLDGYLKQGDPKKRPKPDWVGQAPNQSDTVSLAMATDAVIGVCEVPEFRQLASRWMVYSLNPQDGLLLWQCSLPSAAIPGGLLVDRVGRVIVVLENGGMACFGGGQAVRATVDGIGDQVKQGVLGKSEATRLLEVAAQTVHGSQDRALVVGGLKELGVDVLDAPRKSGCITEWKLVGPVPWDDAQNNTDKVLVGEPNVDVDAPCKVGDRVLEWRNYTTHDRDGMVDLAEVFGPSADVAAYAYAEVDLQEDRELTLKIGTNDGYKCWFNGVEVGRFDGGRAYVPDQDALKVSARKGRNTVLLKITQMGGRWAFGVRLTDPKNKPVDLTKATK